MRLLLMECITLRVDYLVRRWRFADRLRLVDRRYERASTVLTSNKSFMDWGDVFGDHVIATAILDRLLHHSSTLNIKGESYRLKDKRKAGLVPGPVPEPNPAEEETAAD